MEDSEEEITEPVSQINESVDTPEDPASYVPASSEITPQDLQLEVAGMAAEETPENYYGVRPELRAAVIDTESTGDENAIGPLTKYGRAKGMMQVLDETGIEQHKKLGLKEPYDPFNGEQNKIIGTAYLGEQIKNFGSEELGLAAYNWGPGKLTKFLNKDENKGKSYDEIKSRLPSDVRKYVTDNIEKSYGGEPRARARIQDDGFKPPLPSQVPNTQGGFADAVLNIIKAPDFDELPLNDKVSRIGKIYGLHKTWGPGTGDVLKEVISNYTSVAPIEERPVLSEIIGPTPIVPSDSDPGPMLKAWEGRRRQELIREGINPDFFGKQFDEYFAKELKDETEAHTIRNRSFIGTGINRTANAVRDAAKGVTSVATIPVAAVARLGTAGAATEFANSVEAIPDKIFGIPANDYLFEVGADGRPLTNSDGTYKLKMYSGIFQGIGMMGAQMAGGLALKGFSTVAKAIPFMTSNTLFFSNEIFRDTYERTKGDVGKSYLASTFALPAAAIASIGQLATIAKWANPALEAMSTYNKGKYIAQAFARNAGVGAVTQGAANVVKQAGQNVVTDRPFDSQELKQNVIAGAVVQGLTGGIQARTPNRNPSTAQQGLSGPNAETLQIGYEGTPSGEPIQMPAGSVAVPEGPLGLPGRETPLLLSGPNIVESDYTTSPIQLHAAASAAEQQAVTQKLEAFQNYWGRSGTLTVEEASKIPPELMEVYGNTATTDGKNIILVKKDSYSIVDSDIGGIDQAIGKVKTYLDIAPTPDEAITIGARLKEAETRLAEHVEAVGKSTESYIRGRDSLVREVRKREEELRAEKDEDLRQIRREDLREAREALDAYDMENDANSRIHAKTQALADEVDLLRQKQDIILDPYYHNNLTAAYKNLTDLRNKKVEAAEATRAKEYEQYAAEQLTRQAIARVTGVDFERPINLSKGLAVEGGYIIPHDNKFYVVNDAGKLQGGGHVHYKDALSALKPPPEIGVRERGFTMQERVPDRTRLTKEDEIAIRERALEERLQKEADEAARTKNKNLSEKELRAERKRTDRLERLRARRAAREDRLKAKAKSDEGLAGRVVDPNSEELYSASDPVVDYGAAKPTAEKKSLTPNIQSKTRRLLNRPSRRLGADYTPLVEFKEDAQKMTRTSDIAKKQQALLSSLHRNLKAFYGGSMPKNVLGYLNYLRNHIKVARDNDVQTGAHELMHAIDQYVIGKWGVKTLGDYSKIPTSVMQGIKDMADVFYPRKGLPETVKIKEGFSMFFENYTTGQPVNREVLAWYKGTFSKEHPEIYKALEDIKSTMFDYFNQTPELQVESQIISKRQNNWDNLKKKLNFTAAKDYAVDRMSVFNDIDRLTGGRYGVRDARDSSYKRAGAIVDHLKSRGLTDLDGNLVDGESIDSFMRPIEKSKEKSKAFLQYTVALANQARRKKGIEPGGNEADDLKVINKVQNDPAMGDVVQAAQSMWRMNDYVNDLIASASPEMAYLVAKRRQDNMAATGTTHGYYLPFQRGGYGSFNPNKKSVGSTKDKVNPYENLLDAYTDSLQMALDSRFKRALVEAASGPEASHIGMLMREVSNSKRKGEIIAQQEAMANADLGKDATRLEKLLHAVMNTKIQGNDKFEIFSYLDGKNGLRIFEVDPRVNKALKDELPDIVNNPWFKLLRAATPVVRATATVARPAFVAKNFVRDNFTLMRYIAAHNPGAFGTAKDIIQLEKDILKSFYDVAMYGAGVKQDNWAGLMNRLGLSNSNLVGASKDIRIDVQKKFGKDILDVGDATLSKLESFMSGPENAIRLASMRYELRRLGVTDPNQRLTPQQAQEAILAFKRGTTNFQVQGSGARAYNLLVPFFSARIADLARIPNDIRRNPGKASAIVSSMFAYGLYHALAHQDDIWYKELEPSLKMNAIFEQVNIGGINKTLFAPLDTLSAFAFGLGTAIGVKATEDSLMPVSYSELARGYFGMASPISSWAEIFGPGIKEFGQQVLNRDAYFMRDIVPPSLAFKNPEDQYNQNTTEFAKRIGSLMGWSPLRVDHFLGTITPAVRDYLNIADKVTGQRGSLDDTGVNMFLNAFAKANSSEAVMDVSNRLFNEKLMDFRSNMAGETPEEEIVRKSLERINQNVSDMRVMITATSDQKAKDEIRVRMREQLQEGLRIAKEGASSVPPRVPEHTAAKEAKKAKKKSFQESAKAAREQAGGGTLIGSTD